MRVFKILFLLVFSFVVTACTDEGVGYDVVFLGDHFVRNWNLDETFPDMKTKNFGGKQNSGLSYLSQLKGMYPNKDAVLLLGNSDLTLLAEQGTDSAINDYCDNFVKCAKELNSKCVYVYSFLPQNYSNEITTVRLNKFIIKVNMVLENKVKSAGMVYIDAHDMFFKDYTINPEYTDANGETYNKNAYNLLATLLKQVYKN